MKLLGTIEGAVELSRELGIAAGHISDWSKPLQESGSELLKSFDLNYSSRGGLFQGGWAPRKQEQPWPLLEKTGALRSGFRSEMQGRDSVVLSNVKMDDYGKYHQQGTSRMPQRLLMKIDSERKTLIQKIFQKHLIESLRGLGVR